MSDTQLLLLQQKLDLHITEYNKRVEDDAEWRERLDAQLLGNTNAINGFKESTTDMIAAWQAVNGTMKTLSAFGKLVKWLSGFAVVGVAIKWLLEKVHW